MNNSKSTTNNPKEATMSKSSTIDRKHNSSKHTDSETNTTYTTNNPNPNDVLMGRGKPHQDHPGNINMRRLVAINKDRYQQAHRDLRGPIAMQILNEIQDSGARFLKRKFANISTTESASCSFGDIVWEEASRGEAYNKLSHALRARKKVPPGAVESPKKSPPESQSQQGRATFMPTVTDGVLVNRRVFGGDRILSRELPGIGLSASLRGFECFGVPVVSRPLSMRFPSGLSSSGSVSIAGPPILGTRSFLPLPVPRHDLDPSGLLRHNFMRQQLSNTEAGRVFRGERNSFLLDSSLPANSAVLDSSMLSEPLRELLRRRHH